MKSKAVSTNICAEEVEVSDLDNSFKSFEEFHKGTGRNQYVL